MNSLQRYAPIKRKRAQRRGPWRSVAYRRWIASHVCIICHRSGTQAAHAERGGLSMKGSDASCVPLCPGHHDLLDGRQKFFTGECGKKAFERLLGVNLRERAAYFFEMWSALLEVTK